MKKTLIAIAMLAVLVLVTAGCTAGCDDGYDDPYGPGYNPYPYQPQPTITVHITQTTPPGSRPGVRPPAVRRPPVTQRRAPSTGRRR